MNAVSRTAARALLETGSSLDRLGMALVGDMSFYDHVSQHRTMVPLPSGSPSAEASAQVHESATLVGPVSVAAKAVVYPNVVVSGPSTIGEGAEIGAGVVIKPNVTVGAGAALAPGAIVLEGTTVPAGEKWGGVPATPQA